MIAAALYLATVLAPSIGPGIVGAAAGFGPAIRDSIDRCRSPAISDAITVCGRRPGDADRYRLPLRDEDRGFDVRGSVDSVSRERQRLIDGDGASQDLTRGSCSTAGASGWTGCQIKTWREHDQQKGW